MALAAVIVLGCAPAHDSTPAAAKAATQPAAVACTPPPKELVVKDLDRGTGKAVEVRNPVHVSYTGWLYDGCAKDLKGAQFDTSEGRVTPFGFMVGAGRVIKGWDEGLVGMKEKGKRLLVIPPDKAYGAAGAGGGLIPPNATLVFEVTLLDIIPTGAPARAQ
jgi:FKBP-type peptidyl-prolyl cis-trans isomerase FkpA